MFCQLQGLWNDPAHSSVCSTYQLFRGADKVSSLLSFPNQSIYLLLTMQTPYEKEMDLSRKLLAGVVTDEDPDFDNEDNVPEDVLEEIFSDHESFCEYDMESEENGDSGNEDVNNLELLS
ncbi:hypothetical protein AVEN_208535-1 [Araneus ventricosus]|uniref:Uncharacterized protein n=1 Tax=Araneus ventricosus TaxID=182803 RepID=A0A4Y2RKD5_ARAVE|nr:hypothetical protein AVEN_96927-1 [Araneus ventricosus]GBN76300.1 hypothetical protein AVEN_79593-1 [Araneus ventricosus]GBN76307.1 hypothetical protein AVEN_128869-1 [Araneus ventricosus]GBN76329.1 hypothetical protein AVEN_208535-1 [Araneus ventricosus]